MTLSPSHVGMVSAMTAALVLAFGIPIQAHQPLTGEAISPSAPPEVSAEAWVIWDDTYERYLGSLNADEERAMASTTKLMTAAVAVANNDLDDKVIISELAAGVGESEINLVIGESVPLRDLLAALLVQSANDAAMAIAEHVGESIEGFTDMMNDTAVEMDMTHSHFVNPHGLDAVGHYSSANDLLALSRHVMEVPEIAAIVGSHTVEIATAPDGTDRTAHATNQLIGTYEGVFGIKTGFTDDAGFTLVTGADRDERRVFVVVMGSDDHFRDASLLLNYAFSEYQLLRLIDPANLNTTLRTSEGSVDAIPEDGVDVLASSTEAETVQITPKFIGGGPTLLVDMAGERVGESALVVDAPKLPDLFDAFAWASTYWDWMWDRA